MNLQMFLQNLANGVSLGTLYALIACGYTMVYGILRLINFAHGEIFMLGAYFIYYNILLFALPWWLAFLIAVGATGLVGVAVDWIAYKPLRDAPRISALISAIGVSFFVQNLGLVVFGGRPKPFPVPAFFSQMVNVGGVRIMSLTFFIPFLAIVLFLILSFLIYRTKPGLAMRAISKDIETARLMAVDINKTIAFTFAIGSILAAAGGAMWAMRYPQINPMMGTMPGLKAFIAAVLGGIGSIPGAMLGGLLIGLLEIMFVAFLPALSGYRDALSFIVLILILLVRPSGFLGEKGEEKV